MPAQPRLKEPEEVSPPPVGFTGSSDDVTGAIQFVTLRAPFPAAFKRPAEEYLLWGTTFQAATEGRAGAPAWAPSDARELLMDPRFLGKVLELFATTTLPSARVVDESTNSESGVFVAVATSLPAVDAVSALLRLKDWLRSDPTLKAAAHVPIAIDSV